MVVYLIGAAFLVFAPTSGVPDAAVDWITERMRDVGVPDVLADFDRVEFAMNVLLFVPLGLFGSFIWRRSSWVMWTLIGLLSSCVIELTQFVLLSARSASLKDVAANAFGALVGALAGTLLRMWMRR